MKKRSAVLRIIIFFACLAAPTFVWWLLGLGGLTAKLDFDTGENRNKHSFDSGVNASNLTAEIEEHYNDRVPFRSILLQADRKLNAVLELPYNKAIEPALIALANTGVEKQEETADTAGDTAAADASAKDAAGEKTRAAEKTPDTAAAEADLPANGPASAGKEPDAQAEKKDTEKPDTEKTDTEDSSQAAGAVTEDPERESADQQDPEKAAEEQVDDTPVDGFFPYKELEGGVIQGRGSWLFLAETLDDFCGYDLPTDEELADYAGMMQHVRNLAADKGIETFFITYPNKNTVYGEYMPSVDAAPVHCVSVIEDYLKKNTDLNYEFASEDILAMKGLHKIYYYQDTHWTSWGVLAGINSLYEMIGKPPIDIESLDYTVENRGRGDLAWISGAADALSEDLLVFDYRPGVRSSVSWEETYDEYSDRCTAVSSAEDARSIVIIGDSFVGNVKERRFMEFLPQDFAEVTFINWLKITDDDAEYILNADILVVESAERNFRPLNTLVLTRLAGFLGG